MGRHAARVDINHAPMVAFFRAHGCEVESLAKLGVGVSDLLVGWNDRLALVEIKAKHGTLTPPQVRFAKRFRVWIVRNDADALKVIAWLKRA